MGIKIALIILLVIFLAAILLVTISCAVISGSITRLEEERDKEEADFRKEHRYE